MNTKKSLIIVLSLVLMLGLAGAVSAAWSTTLNLPAASGTVKGTYTLNATWAATGGDDANINVTNATMTFLCANTANSSAVTIATNDTIGNVTTWLPTWDSTLAEDDDSCTFTVTFYNQTSAALSTTDSSASVTIDNTAPTTPTSLSPTTGANGDTMSFSATVTGTQTTGCTLTLSSSILGSTDYAMTHTGNTCTYSKALANADWEYYVTATDGTNTSVSAVTDLKVSESGGGSGSSSSGRATDAKESILDSVKTGEPLSQSDKTKVIVLIGAVVLIGWNQGWFGGKGKTPSKRRRRKK